MINSQYDSTKLAIIVGPVYCENVILDDLDAKDATIAMGIERGWTCSCSSPETGRPYEIYDPTAQHKFISCSCCSCVILNDAVDDVRRDAGE